MKIDKKLIKELVANLDEFSLTELEYQDGDKKIKVSKASKSSTEIQKPSKVTPSNKAVLSDDDSGVRIKSPIIGTISSAKASLHFQSPNESSGKILF